MSFDLRTERVNRGVTITKLAKRTGLSRQTIMRLESGATPTAPTAYAIAKWIGRPAAELWPAPNANGKPDPEPEDLAA